MANCGSHKSWAVRGRGGRRRAVRHQRTGLRFGWSVASGAGQHPSCWAVVSSSTIALPADKSIPPRTQGYKVPRRRGLKQQPTAPVHHLSMHPRHPVSQARCLTWLYSDALAACGSPIVNMTRYTLSSALPKSPYRRPRPSEPSSRLIGSFLQGARGRSSGCRRA